jgi:hypothetical protein
MVRGLFAFFPSAVNVLIFRSLERLAEVLPPRARAWLRVLLGRLIRIILTKRGGAVNVPGFSVVGYFDLNAPRPRSRPMSY